MKTLGCALLAVGMLGAADRAGLTPRASENDYAAHASSDKAAVGVALLTPKQVQAAFATDLSRGYIVVEVGVFPKGTEKLDVGPGDFLLRVAGTSTSVRASGPRAIAAVIQKGNSSGRDITLYPSVGVGVGGPKPGATPADRRTMEEELADQQLPEQVTAKPLAGYLYFPMPTRKKGVAYELEYNAAGAKLVLPLAAK